MGNAVAPAPVQIVLRFVDTILRSKILDNILGILNVDFDNKGLFILFLYFRHTLNLEKKVS